MLTQIFTLITGPLAIFLVALKNKRIAKYGYVVGLISQIFWFFLFLQSGQTLMHLLVAVYAGVWIMGISNHFGDNKDERN